MESDRPEMAPAHRQLVEDTLEELSWHAPAGLMRSIRRWSSGRLSLVNLQVLMLLTDEGPTPMSTVADALDASGASTTGIIDRMEERGLVERERSATDRRVVNVVLTETGRQLMVGLATERRESLARLLHELEDDDLAALLRGSRALRLARERFVTGCTEREHQGRGTANT